MDALITNLLSVFQNGLIYAILALGVFISFRILDMADMSIEGTFPLGAAISVMLIKAGFDPLLSLVMAFLGGMLGGLITSLLHTFFKVPILLSGIITMTGLYSINLAIQQDSTIVSLSNVGTGKIEFLDTIFTYFGNLFGNRYLGTIVVSLFIVVLIVILLYFLFGTNLGIAIRATGKNQKMASASGINTKVMICLALAISNGLIALAGGMFAQKSLSSDLNIGKGALVIGLASIVLGEAIFGKRSFKNQLISIVLGSILYWGIIQVAYAFDINPNNLKLLYAIIMAIVLVLPFFKPYTSALKKNILTKYLTYLDAHPKAKERYLLSKQKAEEALLKEDLRDREKEKNVCLPEPIVLSGINPTGSLTIKGLKKSFVVNGETRNVLKGIDLTINEGDFITIIGGNGSGKTTLLNCISGTYKLNEGSIAFDNLDITKMSEVKRAKYISRVFQDPSVGTCADMTIEHNMIVSYNRGKKQTLLWAGSPSKRKLFRKELEVLNLGLENRLQVSAGSLSGGQRQALTLIMANLIKPKVLLLDEHTAALDPKTANKVMTVTNKLVTSSNITTLMITHNMADAIKYGNRLIMLNEGRIVFDIKGKEKENLTVEDLLNKFKANKDIVFDDKMILG